MPGCGARDLGGALVVGRAQLVARRPGGDQLAQRALVDDAPVRMIATRSQSSSTSAMQVRGEQHRDALRRRAGGRARACRACPPGRGRSSARRAAAAAGRAAARRRSRAAGACRASSRRPCRLARSARSTVSSASSIRAGGVAAVERGGELEVARARSGTGRSAAPRRSPRRRPGRARPRRRGSRPNSRAVPASGRMSPSSIRSDVVLPAPLGPR